MHFKQISTGSYCIASILDCDVYLKVQLILPCAALKSQQDPGPVGAGIGMGNTCRTMADSCQCMSKTTTIL